MIGTSVLRFLEADLFDVRAGVIGQVVNLKGFTRGEWFKLVERKWPQVIERIESQRGVAKLGDCDFVRVGGNLWVASLYCQLNVDAHEYRLVPEVFRSTLAQARDFSALMEVPLCLPDKVGTVLPWDKWDWIEEIIEDVTPAAVIYKGKRAKEGA